MTADQEMISQLKLPASAHFLVLQAVQVANAEGEEVSMCS